MWKPFTLSAFKPSPNKIVNILPVLKQEWELSFDVIIYGKSNQNKSGIFTAVVESNYQMKLVSIYVMTTVQKIQINTRELSYAFKFEYNKWHTIKLAQRKRPINSSPQIHERSLIIDSLYVNKTAIPQLIIARNLICFAGLPDHLALNGLVRNFTFKQDDLPKRKISLLILKHLENFLQ